MPKETAVFGLREGRRRAENNETFCGDRESGFEPPPPGPERGSPVLTDRADANRLYSCTRQTVVNFEYWLRLYQ